MGRNNKWRFRARQLKAESANATAGQRAEVSEKVLSDVGAELVVKISPLPAHVHRALNAARAAVSSATVGRGVTVTVKSVDMG